jgi:putative peptidoglycan lipid II flippase
MLLMFTPQLVCYGAAVVLGGALQAHRRFLAAAIAPLVSSTVVIGAYLTFVALSDGERSVQAVPRSAEAALAIGTTLGVATLALTVAVPVRAAGVRIRPSLTFPDGVLPKVRALAAAGLAILVAQQGTLLVIAWLANHSGDPGALTAYTWAWAVYLVPYAVLAVPIATSAFPRLAAAADAGDDDAVARLSASTTRAVVLVSAGGAAVIAAARVPVARVFATNGGLPDAGVLADGIGAFALGLVGFGLVAHLTRVLYAGHHGRAAAGAAVGGWLVVIVADVALVAAVDDRNTVAALGAGNALGMTAAGVLLVLAVVGAYGRAALSGLGRTTAVAVGGGVLAAELGNLVGLAFEDSGFVPALAGTAASGAVAVAVFLAIVAAGDRSTLTALTSRLTRAELSRDEVGRR